MPSEMPSFSQFAERYSYKQCGSQARAEVSRLRRMVSEVELLFWGLGTHQQAHWFYICRPFSVVWQV